MKRLGVILKSNQWKETAHFLSHIIGLPKQFEKDDVICLKAGDGYLMLEPGENNSNETIIRLHPEDFELTAQNFQNKGLSFKVSSFDWGKIFDLISPDGNKFQFKDDPSYLRQVSEGRNAGQFNGNS